MKNTKVKNARRDGEKEQQTLKSLLKGSALGKILAILCLMATSVGAWATDYVFYYKDGNTYHYLANTNNDGTIDDVTTFNPTTCIWTCYNGSNEATLGTDNSTLYSLKNGTRYLQGSTTNGNPPTLTTDANNVNVWRLDGNRLIYSDGSNNYYLYYRGGSWRTSSTEKAGWLAKDNNNYWKNKSNSTDYRATATANSTSTAKDNTTHPSVSCSGLIGSTGLQMTHTNLGGYYTPSVPTFKIGDTTYYKGTNGTYSATAPSATLNPSYSWSIISGNASITPDGVLTLSNDNTQNVTVRLTVTNTNPSITKTVDYTLTATQTAALNEQAYSDITVTPASQTLDLGGTATYTVPATISKVTRKRPLFVTITADGNTYYKVGSTYQAAAPTVTVTEIPGTSVAFSNVTWSFSEGYGDYFAASPYYSDNSTTLTLTRNTAKTASNRTYTITASANYDNGNATKTATASVTIPLTWTDLTNLYSGDDLNLGIGETGTMEGHYTWQPNYDAAGAAYKKFTYTSANTSVATVDANGTVTAVGPGTTTITVQSIKQDGTVNTGVSCNVTVNVTIEPPAITIDASGHVTITHPYSGATIRYTTNGTNPTASTGTVYGATFTVANETTVKAVAVANNTASAVASQIYVTSGISGTTVILNNYEDHNWKYYAGEEYTLEDGTTYKDKYRYSLYSPDPRNVKITYNAGGVTGGTAVQVSNSEDQNQFVFYETLEKFVIGFFTQRITNNDWDGTPANPNNVNEQYPYTVISNPFSVRPATGSGTGKKYYGFAGWKIVSGGEHILDHNNNDVLALDEIIHFTNLDNGYTPNCTSAEVVFEATWTQANVQTGTGAKSFTGGTYETNFLVASGNMNAITQNSPCTITAMYPDGTNDYSGSRYITGLTVGANHVKVEWIQHGNGTFNANGHNMTLGRGITSSSAQGTIYCHNANSKCVNTVKIESGNYNTCKPINTEISATNDVNTYIIFGCDYDKARADYYSSTTNAYNTKLQINSMGWSGMGYVNRSHGELYLRTLFKSGTFTGEYYTHRSSHTGQRFVTLEGGHFKDNITGGSETDEHQDNARSFTLRGKGNFRVDGRIAGGSTQNNCSGDRCMVLTGGRVVGWLAAGSNSRTTANGVTTGETFVYVGGNARMDSRQFNSNDGDKIFNTSSGGVIYGSGCGINHNSTAGGVTKGSNIVLADNAYTERGIYGGGAMGRISAGSSSHIYILGGRVGTGVGKINDSINKTNVTRLSVPQAGVFGGACNVGGGYSYIYMSGGIVESGIFGGSNISGNMDNSTNIKIVGGQVGYNTATANVHGGGYGESTGVAGSVDVTVGASGASDGATIYGDVYGGSAMGIVNDTNRTGSADTTNKHVNVTVNAGTLNGNVYGGGLGTSTIAANTFGKTKVTVNGGTIHGSVFGCNNVNGSPKDGNVYVYVNGGIMDYVYGGGNNAAYTGNPHVRMSAGTVNQHVFGGGLGLNAVVTGDTWVYIYGPSLIKKNVYGGGNGGEIHGGTHVQIGEEW